MHMLSVRSLPLITSLVVALFTLILAPAVFAQTEGVEVKPAIIEDRADPGSVYTFSVQVKNISNVEKTFYLSAQDIKGTDGAGLPIFSEETEITPYEISAWIQLPQESITVAPGATESVAFTVRVPSDASPGSHFGGVFLDVRPPKQRVTGASIGVKVGTIINLRISGEIEEGAQLREFSTKRIIYGSANVDFVARVANMGNTLVRPYGLIEITDMRGAKVAIVKVNETSAGVFPGEDRSFEASWVSEGFAFGRYQAVASLNYGEDGSKTISAATSFWILPLKPLLITLGVIFGVLLFMYLSIRGYIRRKLREMGGGRGGADLYARRNRSSAPKLIIVAMSLLLLSMVFLVLMFLMLA
jgi:hypothetical protein